MKQQFKVIIKYPKFCLFLSSLFKTSIISVIYGHQMAAIALAITSSSTGIPVGDEREWEKGKFSELFLERKRKICPQFPNRFPLTSYWPNCCYAQALKHLVSKGNGCHDCHDRFRLAMGYWAAPGRFWVHRQQNWIKWVLHSTFWLVLIFVT